MAEPADTPTPGEDHRTGDAGYAKIPDWQAALGDALKSPAWAQTATSLAELVEAPERLAESFKAPESAESIQPLPDDNAAPSVASARARPEARPERAANLFD